ncbi:50S ribosomal protein L15 [Candidatus Aquiluna sp. UB-MaderosW2red]|jgi:large subunit ribosomal protein L15|uniref:50S ribosomal protein L15 n=1 Tax=Candidatus Aquiluna sp. UB-MaderosW2red TaxID=1855377 RepID=UPI000875BDBD|nr:50S ribosomal protein L15 [Candidatus Aquiluna sp. UB-MaderosW2red]SCX06796.1 large subunit ribosomal protein L15 [Candidatus Aquiluna sp. UB-MaderosW2red]
MAEEKKPAAKAAPKTAAAKPAVKAAAPKAPAAKAAAPKTAVPKTAAAKPAADKAEPKTAAAKPAVKVVQKAAVAPKAKKSTPKKTDQEKADRSQILKLHHLRPAPGAKKDKTRKGLGEGSKGKTAGRGTKGTGARTTVRLGFEGGGVNLVMRTPKLRGFKNPFRVEYQVVNLEKLSELYPKGGAVTVSDLVSKGAVRKGEPVKVLGNGDISVKLDINVDKVSASAKTKVEAAGGSVGA